MNNKRIRKTITSPVKKNVQKLFYLLEKKHVAEKFYQEVLKQKKPL